MTKFPFFLHQIPQNNLYNVDLFEERESERERERERERETETEI